MTMNYFESTRFRSRANEEKKVADLAGLLQQWLIHASRTEIK